MKLEIAIWTVVVNHARVYRSRMVHQIFDESRNARGGDGFDTALGERQWNQRYTWPRARVSEIGV